VIVVAVTGGIGTGKSTLVRAWERLGARALDLDRVGWGVLLRPEVRESLLYAFGPDVLGADGEIDRTRLAARAFADAESAERLNAIAHPAILAEAERWIAEERRAALTDVLAIEASLILESGRTDLFDAVVLVVADAGARLARVVAKGVARRDAEARLRLQWPDEAKRPLADFVVENRGALEDLERAARELYETIRRLPPRRRAARPEGDAT
jgi:dephospho-CoA kinase